MYNDHEASSTYGHMKGVLAYDPDDGTGFWLTHSIPNFPGVPENSSYLKSTDLKYPSSGYRNG